MTQPTDRVLVAKMLRRYAKLLENFQMGEYLIGDILTQAAALESAEAEAADIHSCSPYCKKPECVARREAGKGEGVGASEGVQRFAIEVEKRLCKVLGRQWSAAGMSIETLCAELATLLTPSPPAESGWRWVPVEPTEAMIQAMHDICLTDIPPDGESASYGPTTSANAIYRAQYAAMLSAAPAREV